MEIPSGNSINLPGGQREMLHIQGHASKEFAHEGIGEEGEEFCYDEKGVHGQNEKRQEK